MLDLIVEGWFLGSKDPKLMLVGNLRVFSLNTNFVRVINTLESQDLPRLTGNTSSELFRSIASKISLWTSFFWEYLSDLRDSKAGLELRIAQIEICKKEKHVHLRVPRYLSVKISWNLDNFRRSYPRFSCLRLLEGISRMPIKCHYRLDNDILLS